MKLFLKNKLPQKIFRRGMLIVQERLRKIVARRPAMAGIYYALMSREYSREQSAFLAGVGKYWENLRSPSGSITLLRRNTHRIEKGIIMRPRRLPFAMDYIEETIIAYEKAFVNQAFSDIYEKTWVTDVLEEYFNLHSDHSRVSGLEKRFQKSKEKLGREEVLPLQVPYFRDLSSNPVSVENLLELAKRRRSVRWFRQEPVDRAIIDRAIEIGTLAPSACNRQPFEFRVFDLKELVQKVIEIPFGLSGYGHNVPVVMVVVGQQRNYFNERDRHLIYIDASLAVMGVLFALESQGIGSCCVNWPDIAEQEKRMSDLLNLEMDERPIMLIALGYPDLDGMVPCSTKKSLDQIRHYNLK